MNNKITITEAIQKQIDDAALILERLSYMTPPPVRQTSTVGEMCEVHYSRMDVKKAEGEVEKWQYATKTVLATFLGGGSNAVHEFEQTMVQHGMYLDAKEELTIEVRKGRDTLSNIIMVQTLKSQVAVKDMTISQYEEAKPKQKPPKVFISHKKEDKEYADALVSLINFIIGADGDKIFCSSVQGYGIRLSRDIMNELKGQFDRHDIFMVIIHSPRYYQSAICLNEMGAAWVLGSKFASFMTKDCDFCHLQGVINKETICINLNDDEDQLNAHLNDFKKDLVNFFGATPTDENKWENARNRFVKEVTALSYTPVARKNLDLFELWYLPAFDHIFELLDLEHFQDWTYPCAIGGNTILNAAIYDKIDIITNYILSRPKYQEYGSWDALMRNLALLVDDFRTVFSQHAVKIDEDRYTVERFYKKTPNNIHYEEDLTAYNEHVRLISDMLFELARLCNLILNKIREKYPNYRQDVGVLRIDYRISVHDLVYRDSEISDTPYPGLKEYIRVRLTRETHLGNNPNIEESGY